MSMQSTKPPRTGVILLVVALLVVVAPLPTFFAVWTSAANKRGVVQYFNARVKHNAGDPRPFALGEAGDKAGEVFWRESQDVNFGGAAALFGGVGLSLALLGLAVLLECGRRRCR